MLTDKYCVSKEMAPKIYGIPYIISACTSPFLGILIDKIGKRVLLVVVSSVFLLAAHLTTMFLPTVDCSTGMVSYMEVAPLVLTGIGFSIYAAALWPSIPYVVEARTVGSAFGLCTAL